MKSYKPLYYLLITLFTFYNCVEVFEIEGITYENFLVVEATITNEFKQHEIKLSRTFEIDSLGPRTESNAIVYITDEDQNKYIFTETSTGIYTSDINFSAEENKNYTLKITTNTGENYTSTTQQLTAITTIDAVNYSVGNNLLDEPVITIGVDSYNLENNANYYRYEYEETYKIIAPYFSLFNIDIVSDTAPFSVNVLPKSDTTNECFNTLYSNKIIQTETASFSEDKIVNFTIREIPTTDFIISSRYSILVKQYVQNIAAYNYYNTLNSFSTSDSFFSQIQTGFLEGNINSETDINHKVIGFFEVSSMVKKRLFFNREDVVNVTPEFIDECQIISPTLTGAFNPNFSPLINALKNDYLFYNFNGSPTETLPGPYLLVKTICGDCSVSGTNVKPDFWID